MKVYDGRNAARVGAAFLAIATAGWIMGGIAQAEAATIVQSQSFTTDTGQVNANASGTGSSTLNVAPFNPSLGTLTSVDATVLSSSVTLTGSLNVSSAGLTGVGMFSSIAFAFVPGPWGVVAVTVPTGVDVGCTVSPPGTSCSQTLSNSATDASASASTTTSLSSFEGPAGLQFNTELPLQAGVVAGGPSAFTINTAFADAVWTGTFELTYNYTPAAVVPEPAGLTLLGGAFLGLGILRFRGKAGRSWTTRAA